MDGTRQANALRPVAPEWCSGPTSAAVSSSANLLRFLGFSASFGAVSVYAPMPFPVASAFKRRVLVCGFLLYPYLKKVSDVSTI